MGLRLDPAADPTEPGVLKPQQLLISDVLDVPHDEYGFELPRRAAKTTTILCKLLGRCASRPGYQVAFMAQNGVAGSRRLREWKTRLDLINPPDDQDLPPWLRGQRRVPKRTQRSVALFGEEILPPVEDADAGRRGFRVLMGEVGKGIYWDNGSQLLVFKPDASAVRGEAADFTWVDEAQEIDPDEGAELLAGLIPLMDTKPGAALGLSGTAGLARVGILWDLLERLRGGGASVGGIDYTAGQYEIDAEPIDWQLLEDEQTAMQLLERSHPGIGNLTTIDRMRNNYRKLPRPQWAREYLSIWPRTAGARAVPSEWWDLAAHPESFPDGAPLPSRVAFGMDIKPGGSSAAIAAAWRDDDGTAYIELVDYRLGTAWLPQRLQQLSRNHIGASIAFDDIAEGKATATELERLRPRPRMQVQPYRDQAAGCVQLLRELERGRLHHPGHPALDDAVRIAARREIRSDAGVWLWAVGPEGGDITPLVAATRALRNWDQYHAGRTQRRGVIVAS